jgi:hypothetical protein
MSTSPGCLNELEILTGVCDMTEIIPLENPQLHIRYAGRSNDVPLSVLDLADHSTDMAVIDAVSMYFQIPQGKLAAYVVERHRNGNITIRPEAVFGSAISTKEINHG